MIMREAMICSFFGHRDVEYSESLHTATATEILRSVDLGCRIFYFGGFGDFDHLCYQIVTKLKAEQPSLHIKRVYCVTQERYLHKPSRAFRYQDYDEVIYLMPSFDYWYKSIYYRNCAMIDQSDYVIFFAQARQNSGAYKAYQYAKTKKDKQIVNLFEQR